MPVTATATAIEIPEVCETCVYKHAKPTHLATRGGEEWFVCDRCYRQGIRLRARVKYAPLDTTSVIDTVEPTRPVAAQTARVGAEHPETAQRMQARALPRSGTFRMKVASIVAQDPTGLTDYDLEDLTGRSHQSVSATRNGLVKDGWLAASGQTRRNRFGNDAIVWEATPALLAELDGA